MLEWQLPSVSHHFFYAHEDDNMRKPPTLCANVDLRQRWLSCINRAVIKETRLIAAFTAKLKADIVPYVSITSNPWYNEIYNIFIGMLVLSCNRSWSHT